MAFHAMSCTVMLSQIVFFYLILFYAILRCLMLSYAAFWYPALSLNCRDASDASLTKPDQLDLASNFCFNVNLNFNLNFNLKHYVQLELKLPCLA